MLELVRVYAEMAKRILEIEKNEFNLGLLCLKFLFGEFIFSSKLDTMSCALGSTMRSLT